MANRVTGGISGAGGQNVSSTYKEGSAAPAPTFSEKPYFKTEKERKQNRQDAANLLGKIIRDAFTKQSEKK